MNPLRKRFFGLTVTAQRFTGQAMGLLAAVHDQMRLGGLSQLTMKRRVGPVELIASSRFGQDEIRVFVPPSAAAELGAIREYCVWEGDEELFSEPYFGYVITGPVLFSADSFHMGGTLSRVEEVGPDTFTNGQRQFNTLDMSIMGDTDIVMAPQEPTLDSGRYVGGIFADITTQATYAFVGNVSNDVNQGSAPLFGGWARSASGGRFPVYSTSSGDEIASIASGGIFAKQVQSPRGAYFIKRSAPSGAASGIELAAAAGNESYALPPDIADAEGGSSVRAVVSSDGSVWLLYAPFDTDTNTGDAWRLFVRGAASGEWTEIEVDGGFGSNPNLFDVRFSYETLENSFSPIMWDPITDAVCVIKVDAYRTLDESYLKIHGAWILNGKDCMNIGLGPFFYPFKEVPVPELAQVGTPEMFSHAAPAQFYNARIYMKYATLAGDVDDLFPHYNNVAASYKVGKLLQKKQTAIE